jgi:hypothetical protein
MVSDSNRQQEEAKKHLQEAHEFAKWSKNDRESRLPKLTDEQRNQVKEYLALVEQHSIKKIAESHDFHKNGSVSDEDSNCRGCPILNIVRKTVDSPSQ